MEAGLALLIPRKSYNRFGAPCLTVFLSVGVIFIGIANDFDSKATWQCNPDKSLASDLSTRKYIETQCFLKYAQKFHPLLPLHNLLMINFGLVYLLSVIYAYWVKDRVEIFVDTPSATTNNVEDKSPLLSSTSQAASDPKAYRKLNRFSVFMVYNMHLIFCRIIPLVVFAILLLTLSNYPVKYDCSWPIRTTNSPLEIFLGRQNMNRCAATVNCIYPSGSKMEKLAATVVMTNFLTSTVAFVELAWLLWSSWNDDNLLTDPEFCCVYILRKRKRIRKLVRKIRENISDDIFYLYDDFGEKHLSRRKLEDMYINAIILEGREMYCTSRKRFKNRLETYEAHVNLPPDSVIIRRAQELFKPISGHQPRTILVVGRPGIGKTLLTKKLLYQWKQENFEFWHDKIVMVIRFREFNKTEGRTSLREMLQHHAFGLNMSLTDHNHIHEYISLVPNKAVLIFDGLDELKVDDETLDEEIAVKSHSEVAHVPQIYRQLVKGELLPGITVLTTSRPTAEHIYQNLEFDRVVEIIGFQEEQIEKYVEKFCHADRQKSSQIWDFIKQSPELLGLCYIPVNSYIVCLTLKESIEDEGETNAPRTITELYKRAINILLFRHHREYKDKPIPRNYITGRLPKPLQNDLNKLKKIAIQGMIENKLIFEFDDDDDDDVTQLADSGLFNKLEDKRQTIFCFLHLTIQEFLAALHVVDTMNNVESFLSEHIGNPQWHLVIQFVSGLVGDKIRELEKQRTIVER